MQKQSPLLRLWELGEKEHGGLIRAILSASAGVLCGILPYVAAAQIIIGLLRGHPDTSYYLGWCLAALIGFTLRAVLYALALSMSHEATFSILKGIREQILNKLPKLPLGTVMDMSSGQMKQIIVDQVESMERPLAHLLPEMTANLLAPASILIYLFILDWRMALLSLVSIPVGMAFMMAVMKNYGKQYEGSVKVTQAMNSTIVEYIGGIEVIKAFNQGKNSYARFSERVKANASYFYHWMKSCQLPVSISRALAPTTLITVLPAGWLMYRAGSLLSRDFHHDHDPFTGDCRSAAGRHGFRGQPGKGRHHCGGSRFHLKQRGAAALPARQVQPGRPGTSRVDPRFLSATMRIRRSCIT